MSEQLVTVGDVRSAYLAVQQLDSKTKIKASAIALFDGNLAAKMVAYRILSDLKSAFDASSDELALLAAQFTKLNDDEDEYLAQPNRFRAAERELLRAPVEGIDVEKLTLRASVLGEDALLEAPSDLLAELGIFFEWDLPAPTPGATPDPGAKNRKERRARK